MTLVTVELHPGETDSAGRVAVVTLNDPAKRNALSPQLVSEFIEALSDVEANEVVGAIIVTGSPPAFSSGADLGNLETERGHMGSGDLSAEQRLRAIYDLFLRVGTCDLPTLAAINGPAIGAGSNLALACDIRLAARTARLESRFASLGLHPGGGHIYMLQQVAGAQTTASMTLFGQVLSADEAAQRGLIWRTVDDDELLELALTMARRAASLPRSLSKRLKDTARAAAGFTSLSEAIDSELPAQMWSMNQPFFAERLAAMRSRISSSKN
jgi:enoyl-CoA hydratase